jgi:hypothetical protein
VYSNRHKTVASPLDGTIIFLAVATGIATLAFNFSLIPFVHGRSHFREEDFDSMWMAHSLPFHTYVAESIDEHFVPLHRLVAYGADAIAPMSFTFALALLAIFYGIGVIYMYRVLLACERLVPVDAHQTHMTVVGKEIGLLGSPLSWILFGVYSTYVYVSVLFVWWTAGLHRLPLIALSNIGVYYYLIYRIGHQRRDAMVCAFATVASFGFFPKCVLVPAYLAAIEVCLWKETSRADRLRHLKILVPLLLTSLVYVLLWRILQPDERTTFTSDLRYHGDFLKLSWFMLRDSAVGSIWHEPSIWASERTIYASRLASLLWLALLAYTVLRAPWTIVVWSALAILFVMNVLLTSLSKGRADLFGLALPVFVHRYYFELITVAVVFAAIALQQSRKVTRPRGDRIERLRRAPSVRWARAIVSAGLVVAIGWNSYDQTTYLIDELYAKHRQTREFVRTLQRDAGALLAAGRPLLVVDEPLPERAGTKRPQTTLYLLVAMGIPAQASHPGKGVYRLTQSGGLVPTQ